MVHTKLVLMIKPIKLDSYRSLQVTFIIDFSFKLYHPYMHSAVNKTKAIIVVWGKYAAAIYETAALTTNVEREKSLCYSQMFSKATLIQQQKKNIVSI